MALCRPGTAGRGARCRHGAEVIAVGAGFQLGQAEQLGGLRAEVVGGVMLDRQQGELVIGSRMRGGERARVVQRRGVGAVQRMVDEAELPAGLEVPGAGLALEGLDLQLQRGQREVGGAPGLREVGVAAFARAVVDLQPR